MCLNILTIAQVLTPLELISVKSPGKYRVPQKNKTFSKRCHFHSFYLSTISFGGIIVVGVGNNTVKGQLSNSISLEMRAFETHR